MMGRFPLLSPALGPSDWKKFGKPDVHREGMLLAAILYRFLPVPAASAIDRETPLRTRVETGSADDGVYGSMLPVRCRVARGVNV